MEKAKRISLKLTYAFYGRESIKNTILAFSDIVSMDIKKRPGYSEVFFENAESEDMVLEFANYALSLTIQAE